MILDVPTIEPNTTNNVDTPLDRFESEVNSAALKYDQRADQEKTGIQKLMDVGRSWFNVGDDGKHYRDDQFKNIGQTQHAIEQLRADVLAGRLDAGKAEQKLNALQQQFQDEFTRVDNKQQDNAEMGQLVHDTARTMIVGGAGFVAGGAGFAAGMGVGSVPGAVVAGAAGATAAANAFDAISKGVQEFDKKLGNGATPGTGQSFAPELDTKRSAVGLLANAASGERISGKDMRHAAVNTVLDGATGAWTGKTIQATREGITAAHTAAQTAARSTGQSVAQASTAEATRLAVAGAVVKTSVPSSAGQTATRLGIESTATALDPGLSTQQKKQQIEANAKQSLAQLPGELVFGAAGNATGAVFKPANALLDVATQLGIDTAANIGQAATDNVLAGRDAKLTDAQWIETAMMGVPGTLQNVVQRPVAGEQQQRPVWQVDDSQRALSGSPDARNAVVPSSLGSAQAPAQSTVGSFANPQRLSTQQLLDDANVSPSFSGDDLQLMHQGNWRMTMHRDDVSSQQPGFNTGEDLSYVSAGGQDLLELVFAAQRALAAADYPALQPDRLVPDALGTWQEMLSERGFAQSFESSLPSDAIVMMAKRPPDNAADARARRELHQLLGEDWQRKNRNSVDLAGRDLTALKRIAENGELIAPRLNRLTAKELPLLLDICRRFGDVAAVANDLSMPESKVERLFEKIASKLEITGGSVAQKAIVLVASCAEDSMPQSLRRQTKEAFAGLEAMGRPWRAGDLVSLKSWNKPARELLLAHASDPALQDWVRSLGFMSLAPLGRLDRDGALGFKAIQDSPELKKFFAERCDVVGITLASVLMSAGFDLDVAARKMQLTPTQLSDQIRASILNMPTSADDTAQTKRADTDLFLAAMKVKVEQLGIEASGDRSSVSAEAPSAVGPPLKAPSTPAPPTHLSDELPVDRDASTRETERPHALPDRLAGTDTHEARDLLSRLQSLGFISAGERAVWRQAFNETPRRGEGQRAATDDRWWRDVFRHEPLAESQPLPQDPSQDALREEDRAMLDQALSEMGMETVQGLLRKAPASAADALEQMANHAMWRSNHDQAERLYKASLDSGIVPSTDEVFNSLFPALAASGGEYPAGRRFAEQVRDAINAARMVHQSAGWRGHDAARVPYRLSLSQAHAADALYHNLLDGLTGDQTHALLSLPTGAGKTAAILATLSGMSENWKGDLHTLVVAGRTQTYQVWGTGPDNPGEIAKFLPDARVLHGLDAVREHLRQRNAALAADTVDTTPGGEPPTFMVLDLEDFSRTDAERDPVRAEKMADLTQLLRAHSAADVLVLDEAHKVKQRRGSEPSQRREAIAQLQMPVKLGVTATPLVNEPGEAFSLLELLGAPPADAANLRKNPLAAYAALHDSMVYLPHGLFDRSEIVPHEHDVTLDGALYERWNAEQGADNQTRDGRLQRAELAAKLPTIEAIVDDALRKDHKLLVGTKLVGDGSTEGSRWLAQRLQERFGDDRVAVVHGGIPPGDERNAILDRMREVGPGAVDVLVFGYGLGIEEGVTMFNPEKLAPGYDVVLAQYPDTDATRNQLLGRFARKGQTRPVNVHMLSTRLPDDQAREAWGQTQDEKALDRLARKQWLEAAVVHGQGTLSDDAGSQWRHVFGRTQMSDAERARFFMGQMYHLSAESGARWMDRYGDLYLKLNEQTPMWQTSTRYLMEQQLLPQLLDDAAAGRRPAVVDMGAGTGWLGAEVLDTLGADEVGTVAIDHSGIELLPPTHRLQAQDMGAPEVPAAVAEKLREQTGQDKASHVVFSYSLLGSPENLRGNLTAASRMLREGGSVLALHPRGAFDAAGWQRFVEGARALSLELQQAAALGAEGNTLFFELRKVANTGEEPPSLERFRLRR